MAIDGKAVAAIGVGAFFVYGGLKGYSPLKAAQNLVTGKNPNTGQTSSALTAPGSDGTSGGGSATAVTPAGPGQVAFFTAVLASIGAPPTKANLNSLINWETHESPWTDRPPDGGQYTHNPLNTTLSTSAVIGEVNSVGVKIYSSAAAGVIATAQTLLGGYPAIVSAFRHGVGLATGDAAVAAELSKWSGGGYTSV